jgi:hypothetical protein
MTYRIDRQKNLVLLHGEGVLTDPDLKTCEQVRTDPAVPPEMPGLADMRDVTRVEVTAEGLTAMLASMEAATPPGITTRVAVLTGGEADVYIARLLEALAEARDSVVRFRGFTDTDEAENWLEHAPAAQ